MHNSAIQQEQTNGLNYIIFLVVLITQASHPQHLDDLHGLTSSPMEEKHAMTSGIVPVRPPSYLPQMVKLPRRYEKAALGDPKTARHRKVSLCGPPIHMRQGLSDRMDDLMTAIMWVKQELIFLRQNDILLKRQFLDIHDSIETLQHQENANSLLMSSPMSSSAHSKSNSNKPTTDISGHPDHANSSLSSSTPRLTNGSPSISLSSTPSPAQSPLTFKKKRQANGISNLCSSQCFLFDTMNGRVSSSVTVLNNHNDDNSDDSDGDDVFDSNFFRPRTSSMRTSRDLAALARRRGSKDLV